MNLTYSGNDPLTKILIWDLSGIVHKYSRMPKAGPFFKAIDEFIRINGLNTVNVENFRGNLGVLSSDPDCGLANLLPTTYAQVAQYMTKSPKDLNRYQRSLGPSLSYVPGSSGSVNKRIEMDF